ncbi:unnamed protein product [Rhizoctonia solani]|uniref:Zn(2)-C6 fungal-type domain-containing protein n=1 Tax=Rhizoctonia solani TaxID=456999 RepID=A0A8H3ATT1_9AGAM|nr:unnamed protein product [Rhizoctonia solani]
MSNEAVQNGIPGSSALGSASLEPASGPQRVKPRRAVQACSHCRKHKLRCLGGWPCNRCTKQKIACDFERPSHPAAKATETIERLEQLEASVTSILASMSSGISPTTRQHSVVSDVGPTYPTPSPFQPQQPVSRSGSYPFATFPTPSDDYTFPQEPSLAIRTEIDAEFLTAPTQDLDPPPTAGPSTHAQNVTSPITTMTSPGASSLASRKSKPPPSVESRLRTATDPYSAPFKGVLHRPSVWNNSEQEQSRGVSPEPVADEDIQEDEADHSENDPVGAGIVTKEVAVWLFESFATRCHPFMPVVDFTQQDVYESTRHKSSFLFSTILAIAARFDQTPTAPRLASLAEKHLSQTLLRKQHCLADVQATLLLAGWGLQPGGGGPDAWLLTGHAWRMGRRLGLWKKPTSRGQASMPRWRTWICLFAYDRCLSLGFGRPASQFDTETLDVAAFIRECESRASGSLPASTGDFFIASQVQLMFIGRDLCAWLETMRDKKAGWSWEMLQEMNERLDKWSRDWTWSTLNSAMAIIQMHHDSATTDGGMSYSIDYLTIVLATAAVFLIRLVRSQTRLLDTNVGVHYIKLAVSALEKSEKSQTKLSTHLARTVRDMARAAGLTDAFPHTENSPERMESDGHANELDKIPLDSTFEALLAFQNQTDPSYLELLFGSEFEVGGVGPTWAVKRDVVGLPEDQNRISTMGDVMMKDTNDVSETKLEQLQLTNLPHELISEIARRLEPLDLIHLVRVNKFFRRLFLDCSTAKVWQATLTNVGLPPCPDEDMSEPSYAALMFLKQCTECDEPAGRHVDPIFLVRLCSSCRKEIAVKAEVGEPILQLIITRSPFLVPSKGNQRSYWYMKYEYEDVMEDFTHLRQAHNPDELRVFLERRKRIVRDWAEKTKPLVAWVEKREKEHKHELSRIRLARRVEIEARLLKLGWVENDVRDCFYFSPDAKPLIHKAKPLDDADWSVMLPHLLAGLEMAREQRLRMEADRRRSDHEDIIDHWLDSLPDHMGHITLTLRQKESTDNPTLGSIDILCARRRQQGNEKEVITIRIPALPANRFVLKWPPIEELLNQNKPTEQFQLELKSKQDHLEGQLGGWRTNLEAALVKALPEAFSPVETQSTQYKLEARVRSEGSEKLNDNLSADLRTLLRADVIYKYDHKPVYYPDAFTSWAINAQTPIYDSASCTVAKAILKALQHPNASYLEMRALGPSFVCGRCTSDPNYLNWEEIVSHFVYEHERWKFGSRWNERYREEGGGTTLVFTHDINDSSKPLVHLVAEADRITSPASPETECKVCLSIGQHYRTGVPHIAKHMQATHLIESAV